jgi:hypothetical protein
MAQAATHRFRPQTPTREILAGTKALPPTSAPQAIVPPTSFKQGHLNLDTFSPVNQNGSFEFDRVLKSGKVNRRVKKKGAWKPSWKPAYLVLRPNLLSMYGNADETGLHASITLSDVTAVAKVKKTHTDHVFGLFSPAKNYHFQGLSERDTADWIERIGTEARVDLQDDFPLPSPRFANDYRDQGYESSSEGDELPPPGSPEAPAFNLSNSKARSRASTAQRRTSHLVEYSGNEMMTSHSDFSDAMPSSLPKSSHATVPRPWNLTPIASRDVSGANLRPGLGTRNLSQMSDINSPNSQADPERVIRQGWLHVLKTSGGIRQWKTLWTVLRPKNLSFYKDDREYSAVKIVSMSSVINAAEIDPISRTKKFCFQVIVEDKTFRLAAEDEETLDRWVGALKSVLARRDARRDEIRIAEGVNVMNLK